MRIRRAVIVPAILTLGAAGSVLTTSAVPLMATQASSAYVLAATSAKPDFVYHW